MRTDSYCVELRRTRAAETRHEAAQPRAPQARTRKRHSDGYGAADGPGATREMADRALALAALAPGPEASLL